MTDIEKTLRAERDRLWMALAGLVGASDVTELQGMLKALRDMLVPDNDKRYMLEAIDALLAERSE